MYNYGEVIYLKAGNKYTQWIKWN